MINMRDNIRATCTNAELEELFELEKNATPLPWWGHFLSGITISSDNGDCVMDLDTNIKKCKFRKGLASEEKPDCFARINMSKADFDFMLAAVNAAPVLARMVRWLQFDNDRLGEAIDIMKFEHETLAMKFEELSSKTDKK